MLYIFSSSSGAFANALGAGLQYVQLDLGQVYTVDTVKVWHYAKGKVLGKDKVEVTCEKVPRPIAVRYAWADNPVCNLASMEGLPLTPFRTDDFEMKTKPKPADAAPVKK